MKRRDFLRNVGSMAAGAATASVAGCRHLPSSAYAPAVLAPAAPLTGANSLGAQAAEHGLLYGCAVDPAALASDPNYAALIRAQAKIVVAENAMKWGPLRPTPTTYQFDTADALVAFAEANKMKIRGHNLAWHRQNPTWLDTTLNQSNARETLVTHIETVAGRYAGRMHSWDVVNEAIQISDGRSDGMRLTPWLKFVGDDYIELAFKTARNADPQALLTYNDYGIEDELPASEQKRQAVLVLLRRMIARQVPIDAVGIQAHISAANQSGYGDGLKRFMASVRELGLQIFLTEMDVNDRNLPLAEAGRDTAVAETYKQFLDLTLADPALRAVLTWGITDKYTWLNGEGARADKLPERPLPFAANYQGKPAAFAMRNVFEQHRSS